MTSTTLAKPDAHAAGRAFPVGAVTLRVVDAAGREWRVTLPETGDEDARFSGTLGQLRFDAELKTFPELRRMRWELTVHNPRRARHAGGLWDLGDAGSLLLREWAIEIPVPGERDASNIEWIEAPGAEVQQTTGRLSIYQESSGGENWNSRNHVNRDGRVPMELRGYRVRTGAEERIGLRANPVVSVSTTAGTLTCALEEFWQQFPSSIEISEQVLRIGFWPAEFPDLHELQAGERNTRIVWLQFGENDDAGWRTLEEIHDGGNPSFDLDRLAASNLTPFLPASDAEVRRECRELLRESLEGENGFFAKREVIDEYGWRNFGDMWADHEEAYCDAPKPVISHYNNQYDLLYGLLAQYLLSGDARWWNLADPLARHVLDVDIYHTDRDKPAYNGGLFWHTNHYHDAGKSTHRTYSASMFGKSLPSAGGGPSNEHNYATGLLLYHQLTGNHRAKQAVLGMANWVIAMDDGRRHILGVLSSCPTGSASSTAMADYHGPGRGAGNSINTLLDGWLANGDAKYLAKAEELIQRTIHPHDDLQARQLSNAELRWSYTVHLQSLFRFLEITADDDVSNGLREYVRASLLHYARWMAEHESFYLDSPEQLEFPTETWAAQELRKGVVLWMAAVYTGGAERERFIERGGELLDGAWERLMQFDTRTCTRPLALVLQQGYLETYLLERLRRENGQATLATAEYGTPQEFCFQKMDIRRRVRSGTGGFGLLGHFVRPARWLNAFRQMWLAEKVRRLQSGAGTASLTRKARS